MKTLISMIAISLIGASAFADQIVLECTIPTQNMRDTKKVVIADTSNGLVKREITGRGVVTESAISEKALSSKNIRLSDDRNHGFRYLRYSYSQIFQEVNWFVFVSGPNYTSEGRASCR